MVGDPVARLLHFYRWYHHRQPHCRMTRWHPPVCHIVYNNPTIHTTFLHQNTQTESPPQTITNPQTIHTAKHLINRVRLAAYLVDMPPAELTTDAYAEECRLLANELGDTVTYSEIVGEELNERGYGGLYGIGKAAVCPPQHGLL